MAEIVVIGAENPIGLHASSSGFQADIPWVKLKRNDISRSCWKQNLFLREQVHR